MSFGKDLLNLVRDDRAQSAFCNLAEVPLDTVMDPGLIKEIPFLDTLAKTAGVVFAIRDRIFLRKIARFLRTLRQISEHEKQEFLDSLDREGMREEVGEKLVLLIERQDDPQKAEILGVVFESYVRQQIDRGTFERLAHGITVSQLADLSIFYYDGLSPLLSDSAGMALLSSGLSTMKIEVRIRKLGVVEPGEAKSIYYYSALGNVLRGILVTHRER